VARLAKNKYWNVIVNIIKKYTKSDQAGQYAFEAILLHIDKISGEKTA